jgi:hypothetical protein
MQRLGESLECVLPNRFQQLQQLVCMKREHRQLLLVAAVGRDPGTLAIEDELVGAVPVLAYEQQSALSTMISLLHMMNISIMQQLLM